MQIFSDWGERAQKMFSNLPQKWDEIIKNPMVLVALIGLLIIFVILFKASKVKFTSRMLTMMAIALALSTILNIFRLYRWPQGGDITLGCMVPILLVTFAYGKEVGFITGFIYGFISLITDPYILQPIQVLFDYPLPGIAMGLAGFFREKRLLGVFVSYFAKFLSHFISGWAFFGSFAPEGMNPAYYSLVVNLPLVGIEMIICMVIIKLLPVDRLLKIINPYYKPLTQIKKVA